MQISELRKLLSELATSMDNTVDDVNIAATRTQEAVFAYLLKEIEKFDIVDEKFAANQPLSKRFAIIQAEIEAIIVSLYQPSLQKYLKSYNGVDQSITDLHKAYNDINISRASFESARLAIYKQAEYYLFQGLADAYIQPAKYLLMQQVSTGGTIKQAKSVVNNWNNGTLDTGKLATDRHTPRLQAYATQIARDTIYTYQGTIQDTIKQKHGLTKFIYVGGLVKDSRPFCRHLVGLQRKIDIDEIPPLVIAYPQGLKPNTTKASFYEVRGGFNCNHIAMPVR